MLLYFIHKELTKNEEKELYELDKKFYEYKDHLLNLEIDYIKNILKNLNDKNTN